MFITKRRELKFVKWCLVQYNSLNYFPKHMRIDYFFEVCRTLFSYHHLHHEERQLPETLLDLLDETHDSINRHAQGVPVYQFMRDMLEVLDERIKNERYESSKTTSA